MAVTYCGWCLHARKSERPKLAPRIDSSISEISSYPYSTSGNIFRRRWMRLTILIRSKQVRAPGQEHIDMMKFFRIDDLKSSRTFGGWNKLICSDEVPIHLMALHATHGYLKFER